MIFATFNPWKCSPQNYRVFIQADVGPVMFLIFVNILLFFAGDFMEPSAIIMIMVPLLLPVAKALGIDPIHFGIIITINMELGMITPPVGLNLFVTSGITGVSLKDVIIYSLPWASAILVGLILVTYIPEISLWLPNLIYGG